MELLITEVTVLKVGAVTATGFPAKVAQLGSEYTVSVFGSSVVVPVPPKEFDPCAIAPAGTWATEGVSNPIGAPAFKFVVLEAALLSMAHQSLLAVPKIIC